MRQRLVPVALVISLSLNLLAAVQLTRHGWEANQAKKRAAVALDGLPEAIDVFRGNPDMPNVNLSVIQNDLHRARALLDLAVTMDLRLGKAEDALREATGAITLMMVTPHGLTREEMEKLGKVRDKVQSAIDQLK